MRIYFETSAVNAFSESHTVGDAIATKEFQRVRGRDWVLSPVTLWEILLTGDDGRKENIIHFAQHLFHEQLLPSPEELIIDFINQGCPVAEMPRKLISSAPIANTWRELCRDPEKTFVYDKKKLRE